MSADYYLSHSPFSDPGELAGWLDEVPADIAVIQRVSTQLVFHNRANGDITAHGFREEQHGEADLRYVTPMLKLLHDRDNRPLTSNRSIAARIIGCCRDFTLLFVAVARQKGIPARSRVGFGGYFGPDWYYDHVVAEVWDDAMSRWRLVEAQWPVGFIDARVGDTLDVLDIPRDRFLVGADAWTLAREGVVDPERFVVVPELEVAALRSWRRLAYSVVADLAALNKHEMLLWDYYGIVDKPLDATHVDADEMRFLDQVAAVTRDPDTPVEKLAAQFSDPRVAVPPVIGSYSSTDFRRVSVTL